VHYFWCNFLFPARVLVKVEKKTKQEALERKYLMV